jgi:polysaccharide deacetylase family protein (PEP-CTERM system associated)
MSYILLTVDVEDWFQVENLRLHFPPHTWDSCEFRVEDNTHILLDLFDHFHVSATFFVLGWIAERCPGLVKEIKTRGHEVASHGYGHRLCYKLSSSELKKDLYRSKALLEDITGKPVYGYRAPSFSITQELVDLLKELGYRYDSSYNDFSIHSRYGKMDSNRQHFPNERSNGENSFAELPISNLKLCGKSIPWGGGGYFRLLPFWLFKQGVVQILRRQEYYLFYCHPWEFDPDQPRVEGMRLDRRFRHYVNLAETSDRMRCLLSSFRQHKFITCSRFLALG